ncbi:hypothetical protein CHI14_11105 [Paenibacillus sp. 7516]|nr:hypothetical protein CHI14_11105 [Paenibacillus sp. 7516]
MEKYKIGGPLSEDELKQFMIEPSGFICRQVKTTTIIASHLSISGLKVDMSSLKKHESRKKRDTEYKERSDVYG